MASIDPNANASQQALFEKLGISSTSPAESQVTSKDNLGQEDFLQLMTTQLQNQDPFAPMENGDFIAQMAQFSTVTGIRDISDSLSQLGEQFKKMRIATATNLLGHSVLVPGDMARPDDNGEIHGVLELPEAASSVKVTYTDAVTGETLNHQDLGPQNAGLTGVSWTDIPDEIIASTNGVKLNVVVNTGEGEESLNPSVYARVMSATAMDENTDDVVVSVQDYGTLPASELTQIR